MLIRSVEKFLRQHDMAATKFGRLAAHDPRFVLDLRMGREPRDRTEQRIRGFMAGFEAAREAAHAGNRACRMKQSTRAPRAPHRRRPPARRAGRVPCAHGQVLTHTEKAWASITFAGTRQPRNPVRRRRGGGGWRRVRRRPARSRIHHPRPTGGRCGRGGSRTPAHPRTAANCPVRIAILEELTLYAWQLSSRVTYCGNG